MLSLLPTVVCREPSEEPTKLSLVDLRRNEEEMKKVGLVFLPAPLAGHLISMMEAAKRLLQQDSRFSITVLLIRPSLPGVSISMDSYIKSISFTCLDIRFEELPVEEAPLQYLSHGPAAWMSILMEKHKPHVKVAISRCCSSIPVAALVIDGFATTMIDAAGELGVPTYLYFTSSAAMLGLMLYSPTLHEKIPLEFREVREDIEVPGLSPIPSLCMPSSIMDKKKLSYTWFVHSGSAYQVTKGIIVNTFAELEHPTLEALAEGRFVTGHPTPPIYAIGPVVALQDPSKAGVEGHECIKWLDKQPPASVVFLCFGSMGSFDGPQIKEIASGLEKSGYRFLWSLRKSSVGALPLPTDANLEKVLPEGFVKRTKERGLVWPSSIPQVEILAHSAVGGFVTHCGWNSILESLWFGVPMLTWPLYAEQHLNALQLARDLGLAVKLRVDRKDGGFVGTAELENGLRNLMEDCKESNKVRERIAGMKVASRKASQEGGSSFVALQRLAEAFASELVP